ncbi:MAG: IPT/TIG domain-containing protein, partial [Granulicella sp.]
MPRSNEMRRYGLAVLCAGLLILVGGGVARGATPRWVTGPPFFTTAGQNVIWYTDQPLYFTDPGDLSTSVNHAAADAMVAAAASVWNVPTARMVLQQGGTLDEQVSSANVYLQQGAPGTSGLVFPADVSSTNYAAKQIAVIYDRDGSVTDLLLGSGASDPSGCRQNAVTESVDLMASAGTIRHALLILNGRCTGPAAEQQLQMQYQLERAFGRVLGLGWSQLNDNAFTGTPQPTYAQIQHWPIMHPIDIVCGLYTYQCLPQPFTLRDDDVASITQLYPVTAAPMAGKILSLTQASMVEAVLSFPTQEGMAGMNVVIRRAPIPRQVVDSFDDVSTVSGIQMRQQSGSPVAPAPTGFAGTQGTASYVGYDYARIGAPGFVHFQWVPVLPGQAANDLYFRTEAINPLYVGEYAIGPYQNSTVQPSGSPMTWRINYAQPGWYGSYGYYEIANSSAASTCATGSDGTERAAAAPAVGGWWTGLLCGVNTSQWYFGHTAWTALPVKAARSFTVEVTALDEQGVATANKARPVIGVWAGADAFGSLPDVSAPAAFNGVAVGMTSVAVQSSSVDTLRIAIAEERGDGRPDYNYQARILYADTVAPAVVNGGTQVTITGMGFRPGNTVTVGGVAAKVSSWTSTAIVVTVPYLKSVLPGTTVAVDVAVMDASTGGSTVMTGALQYVYTALPYVLALVSGPSGSLPVGLAAVTPFVVEAIDIDGVTPLVGVPVVFTTTSGTVAWSACGGSTCTVTTDANGLASIGVTPLSMGAVTLQAAALGATQTDSFQGVALIRLMTVTPAATYLAAGATASWGVQAWALQQGLPALLTPVSWGVSGVGMVLSGLQNLTDLLGGAQATVTAGPLTAGAQVTGSACAWGSICGSFVVSGVDPSEFVVAIAGGAGQAVAATETLLPMTFTVTDGVGNPVVGATVTVHQTLNQWTA